MTPEEIKAKSLELAALYTAKGNGKTLRYAIAPDGPDPWIDHVDGAGPNLASDLSLWQVKPEPRRMFQTTTATASDEGTADQWRKMGIQVTEWVEVLP